MILAAGYGTRLAPITDHIPKPLLPVGDRPLLDRIIASFDRAGVYELAVNTHHLGDQIIEYLGQRPDADRFTLFPETEIMGTGGALDGAREFLSRGDFFLLHNGDVLCEVDFVALATEHQSSGALATILLVDWPDVNSVVMAEDGRALSIAGQPVGAADLPGRRLTYAGVGAFSTRLLDEIGPGFSSLIDPLIKAMKADPDCVRGFHRPGIRWDDLGTLPRLLLGQPESLSRDLREGFPVGSSGGASGVLPVSPARLERITGHGSDRRFWRIQTRNWSAVAMQNPPEDSEFRRQVEIGEFLRAHDLGAPETLSVHEDEQVLLTEDLGSVRLYEKATDSAVEAAPFYDQAVDNLLRLQTITERAASECPLAVDRSLDHAALRWETGYFRDHFLTGHLNLLPESIEGLDAEFETLATVVASQPQVLIHRDFQAQNIHVTAGAIRLVDFQGMRLGPLGYDAASLIFDPYVDLGPEERSRLLDRFAGRSGSAFGLQSHEVRAMVLSAALQRLMQALGAFGFLGHVKQKHEFLTHIPAGVARLDEVQELIDNCEPNRWL